MCTADKQPNGSPWNILQMWLMAPKTANLWLFLLKYSSFFRSKRSLQRHFNVFPKLYIKLGTQAENILYLGTKSGNLCTASKMLSPVASKPFWGNCLRNWQSPNCLTPTTFTLVTLRQSFTCLPVVYKKTIAFSCTTNSKQQDSPIRKIETFVYVAITVMFSVVSHYSRLKRGTVFDVI